MTFNELGVNERITQALNENKIFEPTDIQVQAIPHILHNDQDLVAVAQTGTGKTAAFCLPILQNIDPLLPQIQALVLVPTRELGQQVAREFFLFSKHLSRVFAEAVYGGVPIDLQIDKLKRPTHVLVATPGRLIDLLDRGALSLNHLKYIVLDEADEMINMGFKIEINQILRQCKKDITHMLFTATMPTEVKALIHDYMRPNFAEITIHAEEFINQNISHHYLICEPDKKLDSLKAYLLEHQHQRGIAFCRTKMDAKRLAKQLAGFVVTADALHGNLNQEMRDKVMRGFKKGRINLLVATDIAARGIDVKDLDFIIHYNLPEKSEYYTHRSGRTARAGKTGDSVCLIDKIELPEIKKLEMDLDIQFSPIEVKLNIESKDLRPLKLFMNMGLGQNFTKSNLVEFLVEEGGMEGVDITNVVVEANHSSFVIPACFKQQIVINLKGFKIFHRNLKLSLDIMLIN